jgi:hypothetical protein
MGGLTFIKFKIGHLGQIKKNFKKSCDIHYIWSLYLDKSDILKPRIIQIKSLLTFYEI